MSKILNPFGIDYSTQRNPIDKRAYVKKRLEQSAYSSSLFYAMGKPDVLVGIVPLYSVQFYEVSMSQDVLKFRSVEGQFLAHQHGGNFLFRCDAVLKGPFASIYLTLLETMYVYGEGQDNINATIDTAGYVNSMQGIMGGKNFFTIGSGRIYSSDTDRPFTVDEAQSFVEDVDNITDTFDYSWLKATYHKTFQIVTKDDILYDMYIESLIVWYDQRKDTDNDAIHVSLLLRKYVPPPRIDDNFLFEQEKAHIVPLSTDYPLLHGFTNQNYAYVSSRKNVGRYVARRPIYPSNYEYFDIIFSAMHSTAVNLNYYTNKFAREKTRRGMGIYEMVLYPATAFVETPGEILNDVSSSSRFMYIRSKSIYNTRNGSVFKIIGTSESYVLIETNIKFSNYNPNTDEYNGTIFSDDNSSIIINSIGNNTLTVYYKVGNRSVKNFTINASMPFSIEDTKGQRYIFSRITNTFECYLYTGEVQYE